MNKYNDGLFHIFSDKLSTAQYNSFKVHASIFKYPWHYSHANCTGRGGGIDVCNGEYINLMIFLPITM